MLIERSSTSWYLKERIEFILSLFLSGATAMESWKGKIAIVTGVSSGIGRAIAVSLLRHGVHVAGLSRRFDKMKTIEKEVAAAAGRFLPVECDVTKSLDVQNALETVMEALGVPSILINNAGIHKTDELRCVNIENARLILETNVLAVIDVTKQVLSGMDPQGVIININSTESHPMETLGVLGAGVYTASKRAALSLTQTLQREMTLRDSEIRFTSISPGVTRSEMSTSKLFDELPILEAEDVAECVIFVLSLPRRVNILDIILDPSGFSRPKFTANSLQRAGLV